MSTPTPSSQSNAPYFIEAENAAEMARLMHQDRLLTKNMGGVFPEQLDISKVNSVLDVACGPGGWILDVARTYPRMEAVGIDISTLMIQYAQNQASTQGLNNARFQVMNALKPLEFPDNSFDLVNARLLVGFMTQASWPTLAHQLLTVSTLGFFLVTLSGGFAAYWIAGLALRPVKEMSESAKLIGATTLSTRLAVPETHDELRDLANSFNAMLNRLEQAFEQQSRFVTDAAHELRTPLATLRTNLEVAGRNSSITFSDYQKLFKTVERAVARLESLVKALLLLATEKQTLVKTEVALLPLMEEVLSSLQPVAETHQVTLCTNTVTDVSVCGDEHLLALIFRNLIENAIRYNRAGGTVTVNIASESTSVAVRVSDTGFGISPEEQNHIFERFYRVDSSRSRHRGGAGLGLSIVEHLLDLHNGSVSLEGSSTEGSTFLVILPLYVQAHKFA